MAAPPETPPSDVPNPAPQPENWLATELADVGYWQLDVATKAIRWSKGMFRLYGLPVGKEPALEQAMAVVHPDDLKHACDPFNEAIRDGRDYVTVARIKRADGTWRMLKNQTVCLRDRSGNVVTLLGTILDVTEVKYPDDSSTLDEAHYRLLAENATEMIIELELDGTITYITPACRTVLGYEPNEVIGHRSLEFIHPADVLMVVKSMSRLMEAGPGAPPVAIQYRARHKNGRWVWLEGQPKIHFDPATKKAVSHQDVLRDVTQRRETEDRLKESEYRYRVLTEQSKDIIVRVAADGTTLYVSPGCRAMGYEPEELIGMTGQSLVHPDDLPNFIESGLELRSGVVNSERKRIHRYRCKNGDWLWLEGNPIALRDENGTGIGFLNVLRDVTERRNTEAALAEAKRVAEDAAAAKSEFLANMSHELRTPLTSIIGFSQLLKSQPELGAQSARFADRLVQASQALLAIVNDVLDFSKLEAGQVEIKREPASPRTIATEVIELFTPQAEAKSVALRLELDDGLPETALLDAGRLRQILLNLVGNAVKFTEKGSVALTARYANGELRIDVCDTGPGMPDDQFDKLFRRFSQIDASSRRSHGGTGLGLAICKGLVDAMGGAIGVTSRLGEGSTFSIAIPAEAVDASRAETSGASFPGFAGLRILAADDNAANRALVGAMLQPLDIALTLAVDGQEAVRLATVHTFDVILMDLHMPGMDGYDAAREIRKLAGPNALTPILAFTADGTLRKDSEDALFNGIVTKPVSPAALLQAIMGAHAEPAFAQAS